jgi:hypothetical protein
LGWIQLTLGLHLCARIRNQNYDMKKFLSFLAIAAMMTAFVSCDNEETTPDAPSVTAPGSVTNVQVNASSDITFAVTVPGGYQSADVTATGGTATKKSEPAVGDKTGNLVVTFTADETSGAGAVSITITDKNNKTATQSATVNKTSLPEPEIVVVSGLIEADVTWTANNIYELANRVIVTNGATLTIEAGTLVKGRTGEGSLASALIISRGSKIIAEGTAENPIIFTSVEDEITVGEKVSPNLTELDNAKWGGLLILGAAPISAKNGDTESNIEGIPADEAYGVYGGDNSADNSGVLKYISIRHGGSLIGAGNEINGLTLGGVGSGTLIQNIEIFATLDDGIELFGGTVNIDNLLVYWQGDDGIDIDQNYAGTITNFMVYQGDGVGTDEGLELDGPEGTTNKSGLFTLINGTIVSDGIAGSAADIKADAQGTIENAVFTGYTSAKLKFEGEYSAGDCSDHASKVYADAVQNLLDGKFQIIDSKFDALSVYSKVDANNTALCASISESDKAAVSAMATSKTDATGADASAFAWTAAFAGGFIE